MTQYIVEHSESKFAFYITVKPLSSLPGGLPVKHITEIADRAQDYFVAAFPEETEASKKMFRQYGFHENDLFWIHHSPIMFSGKGKYADHFGNRACLTEGCSVIFEGYNSVVEADTIHLLQPAKIYCGNHAIVKIGKNVQFNGGVKIVAKELAAEDLFPPIVTIGENVRMDNCTITSFSGEIRIGDQCTFGKNAAIVAGYGMGISLGKDCMFSHDVWLFSGDGHQIFDLRTGKSLNSIQNIPEEKRWICLDGHVWCGLRACILNGTKIGSGSVIGANSLVKGYFTNNCILAGNPARVIRKDIAWSRQPVEEELELCEQEYRMFSQ